MVLVTRLNGTVFHVNSDLIEFIEETPDTVITLTSGKKVVVTEPSQVILDRIIAFRNSVVTGLPPAKEREK